VGVVWVAVVVTGVVAVLCVGLTGIGEVLVVCGFVMSYYLRVGKWCI
jgi:hypothetical protein